MMEVGTGRSRVVKRGEINRHLLELRPRLVTYFPYYGESGFVAMLGVALLRGVLSACSTMFGSVGVFFLYLSVLHPAFSPHALFFLSVASGIVLTAPK